MTREEEADLIRWSVLSQMKEQVPFEELDAATQARWLLVRDTVRELFAPEWDSIKTAPRGKYVEIASPKGPKTVFKKDVVWTYKIDTGHMTTSHWIEEESRWNGYATGESPDLWHPYFPMAPKVDLGDDLI